MFRWLRWLETSFPCRRQKPFTRYVWKRRRCRRLLRWLRDLVKQAWTPRATRYACADIAITRDPGHRYIFLFWYNMAATQVSINASYNVTKGRNRCPSINTRNKILKHTASHPPIRESQACKLFFAVPCGALLGERCPGFGSKKCTNIHQGNGQS